MKVFVFVLIFVSGHSWAQSQVEGDLKIEVNADGSLSFFLESDSVISAMDKPDDLEIAEIEALLADGGMKISAFEITNNESAKLGYFVTRSGETASEPLDMAMNTGYVARAVDLDTLPTKVKSGYTLSSFGSNPNTVWLPTEAGELSVNFENVIPQNWSATKLTKASLRNTRSRVPVPNEDFTAAIRESLLLQAKGIACKASIMPKDVGASVSLSASAGFIVGGEGTVSFSATWDTSDLCK